MCLRKCHQHDDIEDGHWYWGGSVEKIKILTCRDCHHVFIMCSSSFIIQSSIINHQSSHSFSRYKCIYINIFIPTSFPMSSPSSTHLHACWYNGYDYPAVEIGYHPPRGPKASLETVARHDETWGCTYTFWINPSKTKTWKQWRFLWVTMICRCIYTDMLLISYLEKQLCGLFQDGFTSDCFPSTLWARPYREDLGSFIPIGGVELEGFWSLGRSNMSFPGILGG